MSNQLKIVRLLNSLQAEGNEVESNAAFTEIMREKVAIALDVRKVAITTGLFESVDTTKTFLSR